MKIFYLTSTGNNLAIGKELGGELYSIPKILKKGNLEFEDDQIGIIFPCYYLGTPRMVQEFLQKATLKSEYIFGIMSYGNKAAGGLNHFKKIANEYGVRLSYLNSILMVDNYLKLFDMEKQKLNEPKKKIDENLAKIVEDINSRKKFIKNTGFLTNTLTDVAQIVYKRTHGKTDKNFTVEDSCNGCKMCEKVCPVENIKVKNKPVFLHHCEECFACTHHCPQNAIRVKGEKSRERFINENVKLSEIINANN
ncbi:EFR1 family ferrodoxin [Anaeromicrobium sediminis]|uniref:4Fe-4S ferredoxin n=1 Tax=Anaeromicrobium sediminis TaxID=1478221 RepID=A0A267MIJ5_9FIRM|nr:EFR1 family ferrodoxin [Anaeromicrobium sediminis]PAB58620.1 4Fe-4S ferredoxin [Anaeromicrobium sediminis]